jgi:hypothetical protein
MLDAGANQIVRPEELAFLREAVEAINRLEHPDPLPPVW